ncbi:MAG: hypothetical protein ACTHYC_07690 [Sphingobacterium sp.]
MRKILTLVFAGTLVACNPTVNQEAKLADRISQDSLLTAAKNLAQQTVESGFSAGDGYQEVWIRDFNTFVGLATELSTKEAVKENLRPFFRLQDSTGSIVDGFVPQEKAETSPGGYAYIFNPAEPDYAGHKNTVETDQESSLVQAVYKYVQKSGDVEFLEEEIQGETVAERLNKAMEFLLNHRYDQEYGLLWGATTADWGDVQPEHEWGVYIDENTHYAIDIYDNAMFLIALDHLMELLPDSRSKWIGVREEIASRCQEHLWDESLQKFTPHIYLDGSPFPEDFQEDEVYYHGGTAVAIEAGLLSKDQVGEALTRMIENVESADATTIGLTLYPTYPENSFKNPGMHPYGYQNGGDWDWFGGRMIQQLIRHGYVQEAYQELEPMLTRAIKNEGFYEWYDADNQPRGSGTFRGSAGVLYDAIVMLEKFAEESR